MCLSVQKLKRLQLGEWLKKKKYTQCELLSIAGQLQHAAKVVQPGSFSEVALRSEYYSPKASSSYQTLQGCQIQPNMVASVHRTMEWGVSDVHHWRHAVVTVLSHQSSKHGNLMHLPRCLTFFEAVFSMKFVASDIARTDLPTICRKIPYSGKCSRSKTFAVFADH